jgi:hypothetical protein
MFGNELQISNVFVAPVACFELSKRRQVNKQRIVDALRMLEAPAARRGLGLGSCVLQGLTPAFSGAAQD